MYKKVLYNIKKIKKKSCGGGGEGEGLVRSEPKSRLRKQMGNNQTYKNT